MVNGKARTRHSNWHGCFSYRLVIGSEIPQPSVLQYARTAGLLKVKLSFFANQDMFTCNREMILAECLTAIKCNGLFTEKRPVLQSWNGTGKTRTWPRVAIFYHSLSLCC